MLEDIKQMPIKRRTKGEKTKQLILESAISILAEQGIKGTTHRAVASHADIQLSLTTYYFKDIHALVQQAFQLNSEHIKQVTPLLWQPILSLMAQYSKVALRRVGLRIELRDTLTDLFLNFIALNTESHRKQLIVEQQLFNEIQVTPALRDMAAHHYAAQLEPCQKLCQYFSRSKAVANAQILLYLLKQIQYRQLLSDTTVIKQQDIRVMIQQIMTLLLDIKPS